MSDTLNVPTNGRIVLLDGASTPLTLVVPYTEGDLKEDGDVDADGWTREEIKARGETIGIARTQREGCSLAFNCIAVHADGTTTIETVVQGGGSWASSVSTAPAGFMSSDKLYTLKLQRYNGTTWVDVRVYKYVQLVSAPYAEGSPVGRVSVKARALAPAGTTDWRTVTP